MNMQVTGSGSPDYPEDDVASTDDSYASEVAGYSDLLEGGVHGDSLHALLDQLDEDLNDPEKAAELEKQGITKDSVAAARAGLENPDEYDANAMEDLFRGLDEIAGDGSFGTLSLNLMGLLEFSTAVLANSLNEHQQDTANQEILGVIAADMDEMAQNSDGDITMSPEQVQALKDAGLEPDDVTDPKLKALLEGADPATVTFTSEELESAADEVVDVGMSKAEQTEAALLSDLKEANNRRMEAYALLDNIQKQTHNARMEMVNKLGNS